MAAKTVFSISLLMGGSWIEIFGSLVFKGTINDERIAMSGRVPSPSEKSIEGDDNFHNSKILKNWFDSIMENIHPAPEFEGGASESQPNQREKPCTI